MQYSRPTAVLMSNHNHVVYIYIYQPVWYQSIGRHRCGLHVYLSHPRFVVLSLLFVLEVA